MKQRKFLLFIISALLSLAVAACGAGNGDDAQNTRENGKGTLAVNLTDASTDQYKAIYITIDEVQVHLGGDENNAANWVSLEMPQSPVTVDLLELVNGVREDLGLVTLPAGEYTQLRMILGHTPDSYSNLLSQVHPFANYLIDQENTVRELKIPSGFNTGIKIVNGFTIQAQETTELILDFDASRSVVRAGKSDNWHLKPTIKVAEESEHVIVQGKITDTAGNAVQGALVSLQNYDAGATDAKDRVSIQAATLTDEFGYYMLFISPGEYNLVAYKSGYQVHSTGVSATSGEIVDSADTTFPLTAAAQQGNLSGTILLNGAAGNQYASISIQQASVFPGGETTIEVASLNTMNGSDYAITLPAGDYTCIASSSGFVTKDFPVAITDGGAAVLNIGL